MKANVKEMSFAELNAMMEVIATEIENRKAQAVSNYKQALAQLAEMGIDPNTITIDTTTRGFDLRYDIRNERRNCCD